MSRDAAHRRTPCGATRAAGVRTAAAVLLSAGLLLAACSTAPAPTTSSPSATAAAPTTRTPGTVSGPTPARTTPPSATSRTTGPSTAGGGSSSTGSVAGRSTPTAPSSVTPTPTRTNASTAAGTTTPPTAPVDLGGDLGLAGLNDGSCRSTEPPVVLLQGTLSTVETNFAGLVPELRAAGLCPYGLPFRFGGTVAVRETANEQADFVRRVLAATGAEQVDLVGYSQGALVARTALRENGLAPDVRVLVLVAGTFHGTDAALLDRVPAAVCASCVDQRAGSPLLQELDAGGDLDGAVRYAGVSSRADLVVTPVESQTPTGPADRVSWTLLQDRCPSSTTPHESMLADASVRRWILAALATDGRPPADTLAC